MTDPIMRFFEYAHLPPGPMRDTSRAVFNVATQLDAELTDSDEKSAGMHKLLEAKDCLVRAAMPGLAESFRQAHNAAGGPQVPPAEVTMALSEVAREMAIPLGELNNIALAAEQLGIKGIPSLVTFTRTVAGLHHDEKRAEMQRRGPHQAPDIPTTPTTGPM